jgi:hypothetical protein
MKHHVSPSCCVFELVLIIFFRSTASMAVSYHCAAAAAANAPGVGLRAAGEERNQNAPQQIMQLMRLSACNRRISSNTELMSLLGHKWCKCQHHTCSPIKLIGCTLKH